MRRVLLVDDDPVLLEMLTTILEFEGFEVHAASDGGTALASVADERPDVVVCDVAMPGVDGLEVCRRLKSSVSTASIPVVLLTVRGAAKDRAAGEAAGCDAYLTKPFGPLELSELLREVATTGGGRVSRARGCL